MDKLTLFGTVIHMLIFCLLQASLAVLAANPAHPELSRFYVHTMKSVSKRLVLRM